MITVGSEVRVLAPFSEFYPGTYVVVGVSVTGAFQILDGIDFDPIYLELVN